MNKNTNKMVKMSLLSALALILMYLDFPIPFLPTWLRIDLSDVPALIGAFGFGPLAGVVIELIKNILILLVKGTQTGFVGEVGNFLIGVSLILPAALLYHKKKSKKSAILGMVLGAIFMQVIGVVANVYFLLPAYGMQMSPAQSIQYVIYSLIPFNGVKAILVSIVTYILYKRVSVSIFNVEPNFGSPENKTKTI